MMEPSTTPHADPDAPSRLGDALRRTARRLALWTRADYRRDAFRLLSVGLRGLVGFRLSIALLLLAAAGAFLMWTRVDSPREGFELLEILFGLATILAAAPLYAADQRQGTFELIWLATGSQRVLLRQKVFILLIGLGILMIPSVGLASWYHYGNLPFSQSLLFLLTNSLFIVSVMALTGTYLPQAWSGGLVGAACVVALYYLFGDKVSIFNIFLNPIQQELQVVTGGGAFRGEMKGGSVLLYNRAFAVVASLYLLNIAAKRLKRAF